MKNPVQDIMQIVCLRGRSVVSLSSSMTLDIDLKSIMEFARWWKKMLEKECISFLIKYFSACEILVRYEN